MSGRERRTHRRIALRAPAQLHFQGEASTARAVDLSMGGVALRSSLPLALGDTVGISVDLASNTRVFTRGEVVRSDGETLGLRFLQLDPRTLSALLAHVAGDERAPIPDTRRPTAVLK